MKNIYILYACDQWKGKHTMSLIVATTSERKLRMILRKQIKDKNMEYEADKKDLKELELHLINNCLVYGHIDVVGNGELQ